MKYATEIIVTAIAVAIGIVLGGLLEDKVLKRDGWEGE